MTRKDSLQTELPLGDPTPGTPVKQHRILRLAQVRQLTGLGRSFIYQMQAQKQFPQSIKLGARAVGWLEEEVVKWLADRVEESRRS